MFVFFFTFYCCYCRPIMCYNSWWIKTTKASCYSNGSDNPYRRIPSKNSIARDWRQKNQTSQKSVGRVSFETWAKICGRKITMRESLCRPFSQTLRPTSAKKLDMSTARKGCREHVALEVPLSVIGDRGFRLMHWFLRHTRVCPLNGNSIGSSAFARLTVMTNAHRPRQYVCGNSPHRTLHEAARVKNLESLRSMSHRRL